jgi:long-chain acyl-CoA synthetase
MVLESRLWHKNYDPGINIKPVYLQIPLKEQFAAWVNRQPEKPYIYYLNQMISYKEANSRACKLANALTSIGVKKGDRVAVTLPNISEFILIVQACLKIGAIIVPTNPLYTKRELNYQYANSGVKTVFCLDRLGQYSIEEFLDSNSLVKQVIVISDLLERKISANNETIFDYDLFLERGQDIEPKVDVSLEDLVLILYTGGTTGVSKGCCITNTNLIAIASGWMQMCKYFTDINNYKVLNTIPLYHIYGFHTSINTNIYVGGTIIIVPEPTPDNIIQAFNTYEPNVWPAVPPLISGVTRHPDLKVSKAYRLQQIACGAAPIPVTEMEAFERIVGVPIIEGYGASEVTNAVASNPILKRKPGSIGIPYPNIDFKVVDIDTGIQEMPLNEPGELCFKGPQVVKQYWQNPEESAIAFKDGWWHSGDIGYMDDDGFIFIVDRKKDMILCSGFNVFCREVDEVLYSHPKILEAGVIGVPHPKRGETVKAFVVLKPGEQLSADEVKQFCRKYLTPYKVPTMVEFIDKLPRTGVQKLDRKALRAMEMANSKDMEMARTKGKVAEQRKKLKQNMDVLRYVGLA